MDSPPTCAGMRCGPLCGVDGGGRALQWNEAVSSLCITAGGFCSSQHRKERVGGTEAPSAHCRRRYCHEGFKFFGWIGAQIDLGAFEAGMPEPQGHLSNIVGSQQSVHGTRMTQGMRRNALLCQ